MATYLISPHNPTGRGISRDATASGTRVSTDLRTTVTRFFAIAAEWRRQQNRIPAALGRGHPVCPLGLYGPLLPSH